MTYHQAESITTQIGDFQQEGDGAWLCYYRYDNRDLDLIVSDVNGRPSPTQVSALIQLLPGLPRYEAKCRELISEIEDHEFCGVCFDSQCDFQLVFDWGNGEWGRDVFIDFVNDEIVGTKILSD